MSNEGPGKRKKGGKKEKPPPKTPKQQEPDDQPGQSGQSTYLTSEQYEAEKLLHLKKAVLSERQFTAMRKQLRDVKFEEVNAYKKKVEKDQCPIFLTQKKIAEEIMEKKRSINLVTKKLKIAQINDEFEAETQMNETQFDDVYIYSKDRYIEFFKEMIVEKARRKQEVDAILALLLEMPPLPNETNARPVHTEAVQFEGRQTRSRSLALAQERQRIAAEEAAAAAKQQRKKRPV